MSTLGNGVRVITEVMPHVRSVSVGVWIGSGSRRETTERNGISHFIEHMLFKGTTSRSAEDIARSVDSIGGNLDAFTAKEMVCYNTKVLDEHLSRAFDVVADLATAKARLITNVHLSRGCVVEPFRADLTDVQIAVRTFPRVELSAIEKPIRRAPDAEILDYRDKYVGGEGMVSAPRELPAQLPAGQAEALETAARRIVDVALVRGVARIDFLANDTELYINEVNTIPGSLSKHLFVTPPLAFLQLLGDLAAEALERPAHRYSAAGADGLVLRSASSISSKLA